VLARSLVSRAPLAIASTPVLVAALLIPGVATAASAVVTFRPATLDFGTQGVGTTATLTTGRRYTARIEG
jgi:hypothetical protein